MQCIGVHTTGKNLAGSRRYSVVCTGQTGNGVEEDDNIVSAFYQSLGFFQYDSGDLHVAFCRFVEGRSDDFCVDAACHVGYFFRTFVNEQHDHVDFRMVGCNGVGNVLHQDGLTGFGLCHDKRTLSFTDRSEQVYDTCREIVVVSFTELELFVGEKRSQVIKRNAVADEARVESVDFGYFHQREIFFSFLGLADGSVYYVTGLQSEEFDL